MLLIYSIYDAYYNNRKKINKYILLGEIAIAAYLVISALISETEVLIDWQMIIGLFISYIFYLLFARIFHYFIGKYWILKYQRHLTKEFTKSVMPKNIKGAGKRRGFKDTLQAGIKTDFVAISKEDIKDKIDEMQPHLYRYDLKTVDQYVKDNISIFDVASIKKKKENFMEAIKKNQLFLKKNYLDEYDAIMEDFDVNKSKLKITRSKYIITDYVNHNHIVELLYEYMYLKWRLEIDVWVIVNQPCFQEYDGKKLKYKMAKVFSPNYKSTINIAVGEKDPKSNRIVNFNSKSMMIAEPYILFWETESDLWWSNITDDTRKTIIEKGIRWFEVAKGHIMGEKSMSLRNGQKANRTTTVQRDLEESFYSVTRASIIFGGNVRIKLIKLLMFLMKPIFYFAPGIKSKLYQLIGKLKMRGWLSLETSFSINEHINYEASSVTLKKLLNKSEALYMSNYQTTLVYNIRDCWGQYNTHYLEYLSDILTRTSEGTLLELPEWDPDLKLKKRHVLEMDYPAGASEVFGVKRFDILENSRFYEKIEKGSPNKKLVLNDESINIVKKEVSPKEEVGDQNV